MTREDPRVLLDPIDDCVCFPEDEPSMTIGTHTRLAIHPFSPITLPPRLVRSSIQEAPKASIERNRARASPFHAKGSRRGSFVSSAAIFSSSTKRASQGGVITIHTAAKNEGAEGKPTKRAPRWHGEPIAFDPFASAPCYSWLVQDPTSSSQAVEYRRDANNLLQFRDWLTSEFPAVLGAFRSLHMLHDRPPPRPHVTISPDDSSESSEDENGSDVDIDLDDVDVEQSDAYQQWRELLVQRRTAQLQAWSILFENARLISVPPGDMLVKQDVTPARDVFFVLSGHCQLLFQPRFLDVLVKRRNKLKQTNCLVNNTASGAQSTTSMTSSLAGQTTPFEDTVMLQERLDALLASRRLSFSTLTSDDAAEALTSTIYPLRDLTSGDYFGIDACMFAFPRHLVSAVSHGALQRNEIGVATQACLHVLVLPYHTLQQMRDIVCRSMELPAKMQSTESRSHDLFSARRRAHITRLQADTSKPPKPTTDVAQQPKLKYSQIPGYEFREEDVEFLRHTFIFQSIQLKRLQFLATQARLLHVHKNEYLFTTGQEVAVYLVKSGQLRVFSPEHVKTHDAAVTDNSEFQNLCSSLRAVGLGERVHEPITSIETRHVELEILQQHDTVGLMEASLLQPAFSNYCLAAASDAYVYALPPVALFAVLAHEPTASQHVVDNLLHHHSWYKARKFTALNQHNTQKAFRLSLGAQRKSSIPCSRCGWSGHTSTSSMCVRAKSMKSAFIQHLVDNGGELRSPLPVNSVRTRSQRVSQRLAVNASRSGSVVSTANESALAATPNRNGSIVFSGGFKGSMLPDLAGLSSLISKSNADEAVVPTKKSELEVALERLDTALDSSQIASPHPPTSRPQTQQRERRADVYSRDHRPIAAANLREEAVKAVARISSASTAAPSPRTRNTLLRPVHHHRD